MKILTFSGGLGNQLFEFAFYTYLKNRYSLIQCVYHGAKEHNGLEIQKVFNIELPPHSLMGYFLGGIITIISKICLSSEWIDKSENYKNEKAIYIYAYKPHLKYILPLKNLVDFRETSFSFENQKVVGLIHSKNVIAIHIRRGDYLSSKYANKYLILTDTDYYERAILIMKSFFSNPYFLIFTDDADWVANNFKIEDSQIVTNNRGENSWIDMYLMSLCKGVIIANSTFSFWGAFLNKNNPIVVYPVNWFPNKKTPNIFPEDWYGI